MTSAASLEMLAEQWLAAELRSKRGRPATGPPAAGGEELLEPSNLHWLIHQLVELVAQSHDHPVADLRDTIRQRLVDSHFIDECGDSVVGADLEAEVERQVDAVVVALERVRQAALRTGEWSDAPPPSQMFG